MSFIRSKQIPPGKGNWYDYEVETVHIGNKVRQRIIRYIGRSSRRSSIDDGLTPQTKPMPEKEVKRESA